MALSSNLFPSLGIFNATFHEPLAPIVATELSGVFIQHKWYEIPKLATNNTLGCANRNRSDEVSHIVSGFWYNSAAKGKVRIDETYDGAFGSSLFDYSNITDQGAVMNRQILVGPSVGSDPSCFEDYVDTPGFPLISADLLQQMNAIFGGVVNDPLVGESQTWNVLYGSNIPATVYLDASQPAIVKGYDFWGTANRTKVITRFFAHQSHAIEPAIFENFKCPIEKTRIEHWRLQRRHLSW